MSAAAEPQAVRRHDRRDVGQRVLTTLPYNVCFFRGFSVDTRRTAGPDESVPGGKAAAPLSLVSSDESNCREEPSR